MLKNRDVIIISSIDWDFIWQGHQEIASVLAKKGNRILFVENTGVRVPTIKDMPRVWSRFLNWKRGFKGIRKESENIYVYSPITLPFPYSKIAIKINKTGMASVIKNWMRAMEFKNPIVLSFLPTGIIIDMLDDLDPSIFIYYCIDDFASSSTGARKIKDIEEKVMKRADLVFATSHKLYNRCRSFNSQTYRFPFGISVDNYNKVRESDITTPSELSNIRKPIVGYVGGVHKWVDLELLRKIALARKDVSIVIIGPKQADLSQIDKLENVFILGKKKSDELAHYVKFFDAGIIPYRRTEYTENVYPTKINEYLAMGKPVISTRIPEVVEFDNENGRNFINFIENENDASIVINRLREGESEEIKNKRIQVANSNSWMAKIESMCNLIEAKSGKLKEKAVQNWQQRFNKFYTRSRKLALKITATILILYFTLFYTPFVWFLAQSLEINQKPQKADAIVVFGGGVGETGSPGKSTVERARFSVELYKEGFAKYIIYSSGYTWKYNDAENMMLFATSMGVPQKNIILDKKGDFTYTNVKYTTEILRRKNFHKILLVSSPYNMRRASLVYNHIAKDIKVIYVPVPDPQFYHRANKLKLEQIRAIMHEYLGIIYYFVKGYI